jgi:hypothetical protein
MLSGFGRIPGKRALVAAAGAIMMGAGTLGVIGVTATAANAAKFVDVPCSADATIGTAHLKVTVKETFTINVSAPTEANSGSDFTLTIPGATTQLPNFDPGPPAVDLKTFSDLSNTYDVHGGTVVPGSITSSGPPKNNGKTVSGSAKFVGNSLVTSVPGPLDTGTLVSPTIKFKVHAGAVGSKVTTTPGTITLTTSAVLHNTTTSVLAAVSCDLSDPAKVGPNILSTTNIVAPPGADAPNAVSDAATTTKGHAVTIDVLANDTANKNFPIDRGSLKVISNPKNGTASVNSDGTVTYTPDSGLPSLE